MARGAEWAHAMQALSHFSYDVSGGELLLCDLQGGVGNAGAVLTDPAICSRDREYGATDLGVSGIDLFFREHKCRNFCWKSWRTHVVEKQKNRPRVRFAVQRGTLSWSRRFDERL